MERSFPDQMQDIRSQFPRDWEVPEFVVDFWNGKTRDYCVIVPVINEGERIAQFVHRLHQNSVNMIADIIIVDGGSTDGSINHQFLRSQGIRGLLTKTGVGRLSAQLRIAYSFALVAQYQGIVTIDGNNKDDPNAISAFIKLLSDGYDFVQASRFINHGYHKNTPLARYLAIKLIHAPLLSLSSGFNWTDTTQGFRAYSRDCLNNPRLKPFRRLFSDYELLAYFSYKVPRIGGKCIEHPATRVYPSGEIPTKISSLRGNLNLIMTLFKACFGFYDP